MSQEVAKNFVVPHSRYEKFLIEGYEIIEKAGGVEIILKYSFDNAVKFRERLFFPQVGVGRVMMISEALGRAVRGLLIVGGISYYKAECTNKIDGITLDNEERLFWEKVYNRGLGEFFYQNQIDFRNLINFVNPIENFNKITVTDLSERALLPLGGGKDSLVSAEILKKSGMDFCSFSLRDADPIRQTALALGKPRIIVERELDGQLFEMNKQGAYNGHVPITGYISFLLAVAGLLYDYKYLVLSLEKSANIGQLEFLGMDINHQYSKSEEFENDFRDYLDKYLGGRLEYFSLLRGYYELKIAKIFAELENFDKYKDICTSCNANFKIIKDGPSKLWCGKCPKCVFVFGIFAPFIDRDKLIKMFGKNLFNDESLLDLFEETWGTKNFKPFECVGTFEESQLAIYLTSLKSEWQNDALIKHFQELITIGKIDINKIKSNQTEVMNLMNTPNVPLIFRKVLETL